MLVFRNPACHLKPIRARQVFLPEVIIKRCREDGEEGGLGRSEGGEQKQRNEKRQGLERERGSEDPLVSSRAESPDSKRDFHIMILQQCIAYFKDLITTAY